LILIYLNKIIVINWIILKCHLKRMKKKKNKILNRGVSQDWVTKEQPATWIVFCKPCIWLLSSDQWFISGSMIRIKMPQKKIVSFISFANYSPICSSFKINWKIIKTRYLKKINLTKFNSTISKDSQRQMIWLIHFNGIIKKLASSKIFKNFGCNFLMQLK
jgi:hypothetical protein